MTIEFRKFVDELFEFPSLESEVINQFEGQDRDFAARAMSRTHQYFVAKYGDDKWPKRTSKTNNPMTILNRISYIPWLADLNSSFVRRSNDIFSVFDTSTRRADDLAQFAYNTAKDGYGKNGLGAVDHAVASGLILLQYTSYWYWLMTNLEKVDPEGFKVIAARGRTTSSG